MDPRAVERLRRIASHLQPSPEEGITAVVCAGQAAKKGKSSKPSRKQEDKEQIFADIDDQKESEEPALHAEIEIKTRKLPNGTYEVLPIQTELSFDSGLFHSTHAIQKLRELNPGKLIIVGIAGPTGAGKSTFADSISKLLDGLVVKLDHFILIENAKDQNYEDVTLVDFARIQQFVTDLRTAGSAELPQISLQDRARKAPVRITAPEGRVVILDGLYALHDSLLRHLDLTIAIFGGVHLDLLKRVMRDTVTNGGQNKRELIPRITNVVFPQFKAFVEPQMRQAKIRVKSTFNPISQSVDPVFVIRSKERDIKTHVETYLSSFGQTMEKLEEKKWQDIYLTPPGVDSSDKRNWIRIRNADGQFFIQFYNEQMGAGVNTRPTMSFEISVKTISGLLSLGYSIGATLHRKSQTLYNRGGVLITREYVQELDKHYIQIKGRDRRSVVFFGEKLHAGEYHIPHSFLYLYFKKLQKKRAQIQAASKQPAAAASSSAPAAGSPSIAAASSSQSAPASSSSK